jgi:hypothetical protein
MRGFDSDKYRPPLGADRTATLKILGYGAADVWGKWNAFDRVRLAANDDFAGSPVDIIQPELGLLRPTAYRDEPTWSEWRCRGSRAAWCRRTTRKGVEAGRESTPSATRPIAGLQPMALQRPRNLQ